VFAEGDSARAVRYQTIERSIARARDPMQTPLPRILIITGLMAAGKSTIAQALAERLPRSVHLRGDVFRKMVVNGRADMSPDPSEACKRTGPSSGSHLRVDGGRGIA
jgi:adenylylsulfate kinase-like enzyme